MRYFNILRVARVPEGREIFENSFEGRQQKKFENPWPNGFVRLSPYLFGNSGHQNRDRMGSQPEDPFQNSSKRCWLTNTHQERR